MELNMANQYDGDDASLNLRTIELAEQVATLTMHVGLYQTALTALVLKYGGTMLTLFPHEVEAALGQVFRMHYDRPDGIVMLEAYAPEAEALPAITHHFPETKQ